MSNLKATLSIGPVRYTNGKTDKDLNSNTLIPTMSDKIEEFDTLTVNGAFANAAAQNKSLVDQLQVDVNNYNRLSELKTAVDQGDKTIEELSALVDKSDDIVNSVEFVEEAKKGYDSLEYLNLADRLNHDFDNIHQKVNDSGLVPYEGTYITAENSLYGLQKDTKIYGRTLQNLWNGKFTIETQYNRLGATSTSMLLKDNTVYSVVNRTPKIVSMHNYIFDGVGVVEGSNVATDLLPMSITLITTRNASEHGGIGRQIFMLGTTWNSWECS